MKRHILTVSILLVAAQLFGQESRFWVGGSGSWTDESHWSTTSGGEPGATVPESGISVVFDENSFSGARNTVSFSDAVQVGSFTATDANFALSGKKDFTVSGSINVDANVDFGKLRGALVLSGAGNKTMNLPKRLNTNIIIDGGNWTLASDLTTSGDITLMSGSFSTAGHNVNCAVFTAADSARVLNIVNSNIVCNKWQTHAAKKMTVKAMGSDIALKDNSEDNLTIGARQNYNSIHLLSAAKDVSVDFVGVKYPTCPDNSKNNPADGKMTITFDGASGPNYVVYVQYVGDYGFEAVEGVPTEGVHSDNIPLSNLKAGSYRVRYYSYPGGPKLIDQSFPLSKTPFQAASGMKQIKLTATGKAKCWGDDVEVEHNISGGAKPYHNFRWEIRKDGEDPDTIKATTVQVSPKTGVGLTITDDLGCEFVTDDMWFYYTTDDGKYEDFSDFVGPELIKADFTVEPSCEGEEIGKITITATGGTEPYKKYYYSKDGGSEKNSTSNVITELEAGNYTIRVEDKEGCDNLKNKPENILRKSVPEYDKAVAEISNDDNDYVCKTAKTYQYKATKIDTMTYKWGVTSGNENADFTGTTTGIGLSSATLSLKEGGDATIELIVTNKTCKPDTATSTLHVIKEPIPTNLSGGGEFCESELPIDISADLATGGNLVGGELELVPVPSNSPDGGTAIYDKMKITGFTKAGEYKFKVKQTDSNPKACFGISDEVITCTFYDTPIINSLTATKNTVCEGESVTITADITNEMPVTISWKKNGTTYTATTSSFDYVTSASDIPDGEVKGTVTFEVTVTNGQCDEVKKTVSVQVDKKPTPTITLDKTTLCEGTSVTATVNGRLAGSMLKWVFDETKLNSTPNDAAGTTAIGIKGTMTEEHAEYSIAVKETNGVCPVATSSEEKVTFYQLRTLSFSDDKIEGNTCAATPKELKVKTNCDVTKVAWTVTGGKGTPTTGTGETFTYTPKVATSAGTLSDSDEGKPVTISASVVSNSAVCPAPSPITFELNVKQMPRPTFVISDRNSAGFVCGLKADAEAQNTIGGTLDWSWNNTDGYSLVSKTNDKKEVELHGPNGNGRYVSVTETADGCSGTSESVFVSFRDSIKVDLPDEVDKCVSDSYVEVKATAHNATKVAWTTANSGTKTETNAPDDNEFMGTRTNTVKYVFDPSDGDVTLTVEANNEVCPAVTEDYNFTVNANPKPVLPDTTEICGPEGEIIVIVTDVNNEREWSLPEGMEKIGDDAVIDAVNKKVKQLVKLSNTNNYVEGSVVITEKNTAGCDGKDTTLVIFKALPVIEFADEDLSATICAGDTFIVHVKTHKNFTDYSWVADNGGVIQKGKDKEGKDCGIFYSYKSSTYTTTKISAAPKDGCPSDAEAKMTLTINPMPEPIINDSIICGLTYVWPKVTTVKGIGSSNGWSVLKAPEGINSSAAKVTMPFEGKWDVVVTESVDQCAARDTASITFVSKPEAFAGNDTAICASEKTFELTNATASFYDNKVADSLTWTTSGSGLFVDELGADGSHNLNPIYQITPADTAARTITLTLTAKSRTPCKATDNAVASITININPLPLPKLTGDDVICANSPSNYKTDAGMSNYVWKIGNDTIKTATSESLSNYLWTKASTYNLSVNYTDGKGCQPAKPKNMQVTVNKLPGSKLPNVDTVCTNGFITLNATDSAGTASPYIYAWSNENGASVSALLGGEDNIAMPNFASRDTGTYIMICTITDVNTCAHNDTIAVTVVPGPEAFAGDDFAVCYGDTAQLHGDYKFADGAIWTSLGDIEGKFINAADTATKFIPGPNDWKARFVKLVLTANDIRCGVATDTVKLTLHPELQVAVGTVKPFDIAASTEITVEVEGTYLGGRANDFEVYLVSPDGTEMPLMKNHITSAWTINPGTFKMKFSTKSTAIPTLKFKKEQPVDTVFGIADWSAIYGKNPAEGGWAVKIGGTYQNSGKLFGARISFTDHKDNIDTNPTKTIKFDSKVIDSRIPMKSYLTYRSPIGLNESCFGMCDAHAIANGIGGAGAGYTFTWVNDSTGVEVTPQTADGAITMLCAGDYTVTVTDGNQCSAFTSVHVGAPDKISISQDSIRNVACHGGSDGYIELSASKDLITHFDFALAGFNAASSDDTSAIFTGLPLGDYKVIVTDEDECRDSLEFSISQPDTLEITRVTVTKASSCVANNGAVTFEIKGGSGKYIMQYDGDPADQPEIVIDSLTATNIKGSNSVKFKIYDADALLNSVNCFIDTTINTARDTLIVSLSPVENLCAGDEKGSITASVSNGSGKYTYQWLDGNGNAIPDSTSSSISKLKEGTYSLYVLDTVSMCDITSNAITLTDPEPFTDTIIFTQAIKCYGDNQASFYAEAKGGTAANKSYNYTWFNVTENTEVADSVLSNVGAGKYVVTITDDNNCPIYDTITIQQPEKPLAVLSADTVKSECAVPTGKIKLNLEGGVQPYSFSWFVVNTTDIIGTADSIKDIAADIYVAKIVDSLGCAIYDTVEVLDKGNIEFGKPVTKDVACIQHPTGEATINTVYGLDADGNINNVFTKSMIIWNGTDTVAQGETVKTLHYGSNRVVVVADDGCRRAGSVDIGNTLALRVTNIANYPDLTGDPNCDGSLTVTIGGGIGRYTYSWSDASNNSLESQDAATTTTVYSLCEGYYTLHIEDENPLGCAVDTTIQIEHRPLSCDTIQLVATTCYGGDNGVLEVSGVGGYYEAYKYAWTSENWPADSVATTASISGLKAGLYTVVISQSNGRVSDTTTIEVGQPTTRLHIPDADIITTGSHCYDSIGTISIFEPANLAAEFGGNVPFKYYFSHSDWTDSVVINSGANPKVSGLPTDNYNLLVVDDLGCQFDTVINVADLSQFTITRTDSTAPRCYDYADGKLSIVATSKSGPNFTYQWSNGETTASIGGLVAGTYSVVVTDDSLCVKTDTFELGQPMPVVFSVSSTIPNSCYNLADGTVEISGLEGGAGAFNRFEFFGDEYYEQTPSVDTSVVRFSGLLPTGNYKVRVTDVKSCVSDSVPFRVYSANPEIMVLKVDLSLPLCDTYTDAGELSLDGSLNVTAFYSVSSSITGVDTIENKDLRYRIDGGKVQSSGQFSGLASGRHTITIGYGDTLSCSTTVSRKLGSRNGFAIDDIYFANTQSDEVFTCPDNELKAYAHTTLAYKSMKWYTPYVEEEEEVEPVVVPDTTNADTTHIDTALAISRMRYIYLRAEGDSTVVDSVIADSIPTDSVPVAEEPVKPSYVIDADGNVVLGVDSVGSEPDFILPFTFLPYGGDTYYYVKATNGVCMAIDSLHAVAMKPDNKLKTHIEMDGFDSEALKNNGVYEVAEGAELYLVANTLTFDMLYSYEYENNFQWATNTDNAFWMSSHDTMPAIVRPFAENLTFKVSDSVMFYLEDTTFACRYTESVDVRTVSGIKPSDVFTPNGDIYNETWVIDGLSSYEHVNIYVFNRWGGRVWQFSGSGLEYAANQWNGRNAKNKPLPSGTYYYVIQCSSDKLGGKKKTGPVTIVR